MKLRIALVILLLSVSSLGVSAQQRSTAIQSSPQTFIALPSGGWDLTQSLDSYLGFKDPAAQIVSNTGDAAAGLLITVNKVKNLSQRTITSLRLGWFIYRRDNPKEILARGRTALIGVPAFRPGETASINFPVVRFAEAMESRVVDGKLSGRFNVEVAVISAQFEDGSEWNQKLP